MPYNIHATIGRNKGKFMKKEHKVRLEKLLESHKRRKCYVKDSIEGTSDNENTKFKRFGGRRIVDMEKLADDMWCTVCNSPLSFRFLVDEQQVGLASNCTVQCHICKKYYQIETSSKSSENNNYDSNLKLAFAMVDAGLDETKINTVFSVLDIPTNSETLLKHYGKSVESKIEEPTESLFMNAIELEKH